MPANRSRDGSNSTSRRRASFPTLHAPTRPSRSSTMPVATATLRSSNRNPRNGTRWQMCRISLVSSLKVRISFTHQTPPSLPPPPTPTHIHTYAPAPAHVPTPVATYRCHRGRIASTCGFGNHLATLYALSHGLLTVMPRLGFLLQLASAHLAPSSRK